MARLSQPAVVFDHLIQPDAKLLDLSGKLMGFRLQEGKLFEKFVGRCSFAFVCKGSLGRFTASGARSAD
jgi:hypothetical protein